MEFGEKQKKDPEKDNTETFVAPDNINSNISFDIQIPADENIYPVNELPKNNTNRVSENEFSVPAAVLRRLPAYYRHLRRLLTDDVLRISSGELAKQMHLTASQIRSDLSFFGEFGQQGYGYNVKFLFKNISDIIGATKSFRAVMITNGNIGISDIALTAFSDRGIIFNAFFLSDEIDENAVPESKSSEINAGISSFNHGEQIELLPLCKMREFCLTHDIDIIVVHSIGNQLKYTEELLSDIRCRGIWNISGYDIAAGRKDIPVENIYIGDSLLLLCHSIKSEKEKKHQK